MREKIGDWFGGIVAWIRAVPERALAGLEEATGLPPGFWVVLFLSVAVAVVTTSLVVAGVYSWKNAAPPPRAVPSCGG